MAQKPCEISSVRTPLNGPNVILMIKFEEKLLVTRLARVSRSSMAIFSLCCATRQVATWEKYARNFSPEGEGCFREVAEAIGTFLRQMLFLQVETHVGKSHGFASRGAKRIV